MSTTTKTKKSETHQLHIDELEPGRRHDVLARPDVGHVAPVVRAVAVVGRVGRVVHEAIDAAAVQRRREVVEVCLPRRVPAQVGHCSFCCCCCGRRRRRGQGGEEEQETAGSARRRPHGPHLIRDELCGEHEAEPGDESGGPGRARDGTARCGGGAHPCLCHSVSKLLGAGEEGGWDIYIVHMYLYEVYIYISPRSNYLTYIPSVNALVLKVL